MPFAPGAVVGGHVIVKLLGSGGMGAVYLAQHPRIDRQVALKVLHDNYAMDGAARAAFDREVTLFARLDHPNIVAVQDRNAADDPALWMSMRLLGGGDLAAAIAAQPGGLDPGRVVTLVADIARALDFAHGHGVIHRDVKPANVLLEQAAGGERAVLTDFGIARALDATATGSVVAGSFAYVAPERFSASGETGPGVDVYALGCTVFQLLTGQTPFSVTDPLAAMSAHLYAPPPSVCSRRPEVPAHVDAVVARAMAKNPADRYPTGTALAEDLSRAMTATSAMPFHPPRPAPAQPTGLTGYELLERGASAEAEIWFRAAASAGDLAALRELGSLLAERGALKEAETYLRQAASQGDHAALHMLGNVAVERGKLSQALTWYRGAVAAGNADALYSLALLLEHRGELAEAEIWFQRSAAAGDRDAAARLAVLLRRRGVTR